MGQVSTKDVGDFQASAGQVSANIGVIMSTIIGVFLILIGIGLCIAAFIPMSSKNVCASDQNCPGEGNFCIKPSSDMSTWYCNNATAQKKRNYGLMLPGVIFILIAVLMIWFSRWWQRYTQTNRTAAQIGALSMEAGMLHDIFH